MIRIIENTHCSYLSFEQAERDPSFFCLTTLRREYKSSSGISDLEKTLGIPSGKISRIRQVHSDLLQEIHPGEHFCGRVAEADGIIITEPGVFGVIRTADCVPVILSHPESKTTALVHAGWKGTCARITRKAALKILEITSGQPEDIKVFAGPCIHSCCYEVGTEVITAFEKEGHDLKKIMIGKNLDLVKANLLQAVELGITDISSSGFCTSCHPDLLYSYRKEKTADRMLTLAGFVS